VHNRRVRVASFTASRAFVSTAVRVHRAPARQQGAGSICNRSPPRACIHVQWVHVCACVKVRPSLVHMDSPANESTLYAVLHVPRLSCMRPRPYTTWTLAPLASILSPARVLLSLPFLTKSSPAVPTHGLFHLASLRRAAADLSTRTQPIWPCALAPPLLALAPGGRRLCACTVLVSPHAFAVILGARFVSPPAWMMGGRAKLPGAYMRAWSCTGLARRVARAACRCIYK
jgi:hypothetical protein